MDRALTLLDGLEEPASGIPVRVRVAELWAQTGDIGSALQELGLIQPSSRPLPNIFGREWRFEWR